MAPLLSSARRNWKTTFPLQEGWDQDDRVGVAAVAQGVGSCEAAIPGSWCDVSNTFE